MRFVMLFLTSFFLAANALAADLKPPQWGEPKDGLRTRVTADKQVFPAGEPIPMRLEIENVGDQVKEFEVPPAPHYGTLSVLDQAGKEIPFLVGLAQNLVPTQKIQPGKSRPLKSFDLAEAYYLRKPGRYTVHATGEIPSAAFEFEVTTNPAADADGDPIGRLLPLVKKDWWLGGGSSKPSKMQPGKNHQETTGRFMTFLYNPTGNKLDNGVVWLWLADEPAAQKPDDQTHWPASEDLGKVSRWQVYIAVDAAAQKAWPTVKEDIIKALKADPK
jgi:hypothetical protein